MLTGSASLCRSAAKDLVGRKTRLRPSEVVAESRSSKYIVDYGDLATFAGEYLDADGLQFFRSTMMEDGYLDDVSELRKVAKILEQGKEKIGRSLTKDEIKAGLDALWNDGGVEGALAAVERCSKWIDKIKKLTDLRELLPNQYQKVDRFGNKIGNIAYSSSEIVGYQIEEVKAFSKYGNIDKNGIKNSVEGWVSLAEKPAFGNSVLKVNKYNEIDFVKGYLRNNDTEYKIIEYYNQVLRGHYTVKGKITIVSERKICPSCDNVIREFSKKYRNLEIVMVDGAKNVYTISNGMIR